jgi:hypothetical protein
MSRIKEYYQDEHGNWLPEARAILAKATATPDATKETQTVLRMNEVEVRPECLPQEIEEEVETP